MSRVALATVVAVSGTGPALAGCGSSAKTTSPAPRRALGGNISQLTSGDPTDVLQRLRASGQANKALGG